MKTSFEPILKTYNVLSIMTKSYCVKERKQTECLEGSERFEKTKNNRLVLKSTCKSCGITKVRFVKDSEAKGKCSFGHGNSAIAAAPLVLGAAALGSTKAWP